MIDRSSSYLCILLLTNSNTDKLKFMVTVHQCIVGKASSESNSADGYVVGDEGEVI